MQPVIIEDTISIAANSVNNNVIASNTSLRRYLRAPFNAVGKLIAIQSAAGLVVDFDYGSKNVVAASTLRVGSALVDPLDVLNQDFYPGEGDQLVLRASNPTGGALTLRYRLALYPWEGEPQPDTRTMQGGPVSIAAAAVDVQLLDGLRYERAPQDCMLTVLMTGSATGLTRSVNVDTMNIAPPSAVNPNNILPQNPFDITVDGVEVPADKQMEIAVSNPTAGALNVFWKTLLKELVRT